MPSQKKTGRNNKWISLIIIFAGLLLGGVVDDSDVGGMIFFFSVFLSAGLLIPERPPAEDFSSAMRKRPDYNKEQFCQAIKPFLEAGLIKEVYSDDAILIANVANQCYAVFLYICPKKAPSGAGMFVSPKHAAALSERPHILLNYLDTWDPQYVKKVCFVLDEKNFALFAKFKEKNDKNGPSPDIDFQMELRIRQAYQKTKTVTELLGLPVDPE